MSTRRGQHKHVDKTRLPLSLEASNRQVLVASVTFRECDEMTDRAAAIGRKLQLEDSTTRFVYRAGVVCLEALIEAGILRVKS